LLLENLHPIPLAAVVLGAYGVAYFGITFFLELSESRDLIRKILRVLRIG
jgi:hypothetical protein